MNAVLSSQFFYHSKTNLNLNLENKFSLKIDVMQMRKEENK